MRNAILISAGRLFRGVTPNPFLASEVILLSLASRDKPKVLRQKLQGINFLDTPKFR